MGRSNLREPHHDYSDDVKKIDEQILKLINERRLKTNKRRFLPSRDVIEVWAMAFKMEVSEVNYFLHAINRGSRVIVQNGMGELVGILPIMKKTIKDQVVYTISHALQYENGSVVHLDICYEGKALARIQQRLILDVVGPEAYQVEHHGSHGDGTRFEMQMFVTPKLPEDLNSVSFSLIPFAPEFKHETTEIVLDQHIDFD